MRKEDVEYHSDYGRAVPAINVKVRGTHWKWAEQYALDVANDEGADADEAYAFLAWCEGMSDDQADDLFWLACSCNFDDWQEAVRETYGRHVKCYTAGRSGGWVYVDGITAEDVDGWDAIALGKWAHIAAVARDYADDVPRTMAALAYMNGWQRECEIRALAGDYVLAQFAGGAS